MIIEDYIYIDDAMDYELFASVGCELERLKEIAPYYDGSDVVANSDDE